VDVRINVDTRDEVDARSLANRITFAITDTDPEA